MVQIVSLSVMHAWILQGNLIESNFRARNDDRPARGLHCQYVGFERNMTNNCRRQRFNHIQWRSGCCRSFTLNINYCPPRQFASISRKPLCGIKNQRAVNRASVHLERHLLRKADCCSLSCLDSNRGRLALNWQSGYRSTKCEAFTSMDCTPWMTR